MDYNFNDKELIELSQNPVSVNFKRLSLYLDEWRQDEIIFFEYLIFKSRLFIKNHGVNEFYMSYSNIYKETRIKRKRIETITEKFKELGFYKLTTKPTKRKFDNVTHHCILYGILSYKKTLSKIYKQEHILPLQAFYANVAQLQKAAKPQEQPKDVTRQWKDVALLIQELNHICKIRRDNYNERHGNKYPSIELSFNKKQRLSLMDALQWHSPNIIKNAFHSFYNDVLNGIIEVEKNTIGLFLTKQDSEFTMILEHNEKHNRQFVFS